MTSNYPPQLAQAPDEHGDELTPEEIIAAVVSANSGPYGWDARGMEVYDDPQNAPPA